MTQLYPDEILHHKYLGKWFYINHIYNDDLFHLYESIKDNDKKSFIIDESLYYYLNIKIDLYIEKAKKLYKSDIWHFDEDCDLLCKFILLIINDWDYSNFQLNKLYNMNFKSNYLYKYPIEKSNYCLLIIFICRKICQLFAIHTDKILLYKFEDFKNYFSLKSSYEHLPDDVIPEYKHMIDDIMKIYERIGLKTDFIKLVCLTAASRTYD